MIAFLAKLILARNPAMTVTYARRLVKLGLLALAVLMLVAAAIGFKLWLNARENSAVKADRAASSTEALSKAREADERAHRAAAGVAGDIETGNKRAVEAAAGSDDPLKAGLDTLREPR
ncbi:MAG TPA: hypothetical protein VNR60_02575 [Croceibacterium sp.]|nr:hypothetical protein [Croceibacterium sp.]